MLGLFGIRSKPFAVSGSVLSDVETLPDERDEEQERDDDQEDVDDDRRVRSCPACPASRWRRAGRRAPRRRPRAPLDRGEVRGLGRPRRHQPTSAFPNSSRWISVTVKMISESTTPIAAAYPNPRPGRRSGTGRARRQRRVVRAAGAARDDVRLVEQLQAADHRQRRDEEVARLEQREGDLPERSPLPGAVDRGRLVDVGRDRLERGEVEEHERPRRRPDVQAHDRRQRRAGVAEPRLGARRARSR